MAHHIPKIIYGSTIPLTVELEYPPKDYGAPEQDDSKERILVSLSGQRQVQVDFLEVTRPLKFAGLSETKLAALRTFFRQWGYLGKSFRYYDDKDSATYETYELSDLKFKPKRTGIAGANAWTYELPFTFRRVENEDMVDYLEAVIANNQAVAADVTGLSLDSTSYKSVKIFFELRRKTDTQEVVENGYLTAIYKDSTAAWDVTLEGTSDGDDTGVTFSMSGGQVQYVSSNLTGGNYTGTMRIKNMTF